MWPLCAAAAPWVPVVGRVMGCKSALSVKPLDVHNTRSFFALLRSWTDSAEQLTCDRACSFRSLAHRGRARPHPAGCLPVLGGLRQLAWLA